MRSHHFSRIALALVATFFSAFLSDCLGQTFTQQGPKLVGTGAEGIAHEGFSAALSGDGNTAIVGGYKDNGYVGAAWVFTRSGDVWTQQGSKLVGAGAVTPALQGNAVALSADGNTAVLGGPGDNRRTSDNSTVGAVWVFTRSGDVWTQQGSKLVGTDAVGPATQGLAVALSADGNTVIEGGPDDDRDVGAAWVFTRSSDVWTQEGSKLVGTGGVPVFEGFSVALSGDGNTAIVGGPLGNSSIGAAWVFTRSGDVWTQKGSQLVGTGAAGAAGQGQSVAVSADGNTAIVGGPLDDGGVGAAWEFTRSGDVWTQQGSKLVGTAATGPANQGFSVALSADGNTAIVGGPIDNSIVGAAWVYAVVDSIPPITTAIPSPGPNVNGWNNTNITVTLNSSDNEPGGTGVKEIHWTLAGAQTGSDVASGGTTSLLIGAEGTTTLTYFGIDNAGNREVAKNLTVNIDKTQPVMSGMPTAGCFLWPPNKKLIQVADVIASDSLSGLAPGSLKVSGTSNEPSDPSDSDIVITPDGSGGFTVQLRADRLGSGTGRVYTVTSTASDLAGNTATVNAACAVPHDQGQ